MPERKRKMKITRPVFVDGELMKPKTVVWVSESDAREMIANNKAVEAGEKTKAINESDDESAAELEILRESEKELQAENTQLKERVAELEAELSELKDEGSSADNKDKK